MSVIINANGVMELGSLQRGDSITTAQLETITGFQHDTKDYDLAVLQLRSEIKRHFRKNCNDDVSVTSQQDNRIVRILTHSEQAEYTRKRSASIKASFRRNHREAQAVNIGKLADQEKTKHADSLWRMGAEIAALGTASRQWSPSRNKLTGATSPTASVPPPSAQPETIRIPVSEPAEQVPAVAVAS